MKIVTTKLYSNDANGDTQQPSKLISLISLIIYW